MGLLKPAVRKAAFFKCGIYGTAGSGKTYTASLFAIGLHQYAKLKKPIGFFDTEPAASFVIPLFEKAGIEFLVYDESRALVDLMAFMREAQESCSVVIIDSITHVWRDVQESYLRKINAQRKAKRKQPIQQLEFHHWRPIKAAWQDFTDLFLSSPLHAIVCGRAGSIYEYQDKDDGTGKKELITTGTRMATEKELGYEPSLLIEMIADRQDGKIVNTALIQKDRSDSLNGAEIPKPTFKSILKHIKALNVGGEHHGAMNQRDSQELFDGEGDDKWSAERRRRTMWLEELDGLLQRTGYGGTAQDVKTKRAELLMLYFGTNSRTKMEAMDADALKLAYEKVRLELEPEKVMEEQQARRSHNMLDEAGVTGRGVFDADGNDPDGDVPL